MMDSLMPDISMAFFSNNFIPEDVADMSTSCWPDAFMLPDSPPGVNVLTPPASEVMTPERKPSVTNQVLERGDTPSSELACPIKPQLLPRYTDQDDPVLRDRMESYLSQYSSGETDKKLDQVSKSAKTDSRNSERRRAQNRNAQRLYRKRKDQRLAEKEIEVAELREKLQRERKLNRAWSQVIELLKESMLAENPVSKDGNRKPNGDGAAVVARLEHTLPHNSRQVSPLTREAPQPCLQPPTTQAAPSSLSDHDEDSRQSV